MKFIKYFAPAVALLALVGCDDKSDLGIMQTNPQETLVPLANAITVTNTLPETLSLEQYKDKVVPVVTYQLFDSVPEGAVGMFDFELASNEDFSNAVTFTGLDAANGAVGVSAAEWNGAIRDFYGKAPEAREFYVRAHTYIVVGTQVSDLGYKASKKVSVTPLDLGYVIENAYYLVGTLNGNNIATSMIFSHSDKNVYDDPVFTIKFKVTDEQAAAGVMWKVVPESSFKANSTNGLYGTFAEGETAKSGTLVLGGNYGKIVTAGQQSLTINMESLTYEIADAIECLYTPGNSNGWNPGGSSTLTTENYINYTGFLYLNGEWLLTPEPNWDNKYTSAGDGKIEYNGGPNLPVPAEGAGLYWTDVNLESLTYSTTHITAAGLIGGFNGWGGDVDLTPSDNFLVWTGELTLAEDSEWKIRFNHDWGINLGGDTGNLVINGSNINTPAGTYNVTLDLTNHPYKVTLTAK